MNTLRCFLTQARTRTAAIAAAVGIGLSGFSVAPAAAVEPDQGLSREHMIALIMFSNPSCDYLRDALPRLGVHTELDLITALRVMTTPEMSNAPAHPFAKAHSLAYATTEGSRAVACGAVTPVPFAPVMGSSGYFSS